MAQSILLFYGERCKEAGILKRISLIAPKIHFNHFGVDFDVEHISITTFPPRDPFLRFLGKCYTSEAKWIKT